jgi:hypothetical protein
VFYFYYFFGHIYTLLNLMCFNRNECTESGCLRKRSLY